MRPLPVERLSKMPPFVCGLSVIRGRPMPVLDGRALLGASTAAPAGRAVTVELGQRQLSLLVDEVVGIRDLDRAGLSQLPPVLTQAAVDVEALGMLDAELVLMLESTRLLSEEHFAQLELEAT